MSNTSGSPPASPGPNGSPAALLTRQEEYNRRVKNAQNAITKAQEAKNTADANFATKKALFDAAIEALKKVTDFDQTYVMPLGYKGDKIARGSAGFGYLLSRKTNNNSKKGSKTYANFAYGFPSKYYRVYGSNTTKVQSEVDKLVAQLDLITSTREKRDAAKSQMEADARLLEEAKKAQKALEEQQKMNLFLAQRSTRRAGVAYVGSKNNLKRRQNAAAANAARNMDKLLRNYASGANRNYTDKEYNFLDKYSIYSKYTNLPPADRERLENAARRTVAVRSGPRTLTKGVGRVYNRAAYALGRRTPIESQFEKAYMGSTPGGVTRKVAAPKAANSSAASVPAAPRPGFFSRIFGTRKNGATAATSSAEAAFGK